MLTVCTWLWGDKFSAEHVKKLAAGVRRNLEQEHRFICFSDRAIPLGGLERAHISDIWLTGHRGCFARLRMFDPEWQRNYAADRLVCIDLDTVITGPLDPLFDRPEAFVIMQGGNAANPCPYNGALMMLRRGAHPHVWAEFTLEAAQRAPYYEFADDQAWIFHKVPRAAGWRCGPSSGVYVFRKPGWPSGSDALPAGAALVTFNGIRSPEKFVHLDWVRRHWQ